MEIIIKTTNRLENIDIINEVNEAVFKLWESKIENLNSKVCFLFCPHTTCGLTINEGSPELQQDLMDAVDYIEPKLDYLHRSNSQAHIKSSLIGVSLLVPIKEGKLDLGTWQRIILMEFDGPRERKIEIRLI